MYTQIEKLASAIRNDIYGGLQGYHTNLSISMEQLIDDIRDERLLVIKEYLIKGILPIKDLYVSINCIPVDCKDIERCNKCKNWEDDETPTAHFEIPQLLMDYGIKSIEYIGSTDRQNPFIFYTSATAFKNHKYKKRGKNKPYVWIDTTPNENNMYDCFVFNAPLLKAVSVVGIFKDVRLLKNYTCTDCSENDLMSFINTEVKNRITLRKLSYYRQYAPRVAPNDQSYK